MRRTHGHYQTLFLSREVVDVTAKLFWVQFCLWQRVLLVNIIYLFLAVLGLHCWVQAVFQLQRARATLQQCAGLSCRELAQQLRCTDSVVAEQGFKCSVACGVFPDQGSNPCLLHWQADSLPLSPQGSLMRSFIITLFYRAFSSLFLLFTFFLTVSPFGSLNTQKQNKAFSRKSSSPNGNIDLQTTTSCITVRLHLWKKRN